jgi:hypothetical protein
MWRVAANVLNKQSRTADKGWSSSLVLAEGLTTPHREKKTCNQILHRVSELAGYCEHGNGPSGSLKGG